MVKMYFLFNLQKTKTSSKTGIFRSTTSLKHIYLSLHIKKDTVLSHLLYHIGIKSQISNRKCLFRAKYTCLELAFFS
jgi:hypothetical protein